MTLRCVATRLLRALLIVSIVASLFSFDPSLTPAVARPHSAQAAAVLDDPPPTPFISPLPTPTDPLSSTLSITTPVVISPTLPVTAPFGNGLPLGSGAPVAISPTLPIITLVFLTPTTEVRLWVTGEPAAVEPGQIVTFSLALSNTGQTPLSGLALSATLPGGLHWLPGQPGWSYDPPSRRLSAELSALEPVTPASPPWGGLRGVLRLRASGPLDNLAELQVEVISPTARLSAAARLSAGAATSQALAEG